MAGQTVEINFKAAFSNFTGVVWTSPESRGNETFSLNGRHFHVE